MFIRQVLDFPDAHFDGALIWDVLQFLAPPAAQAAVDRLCGDPAASTYILVALNANEKMPAVPAFHYRISNSKTLMLSERGTRPPGQFFNNRIGSSDGDCAPSPSHTTGRAVFRIRRLNPAASSRSKIRRKEKAVPT